jgi:hypothetical protein
MSSRTSCGSLSPIVMLCGEVEFEAGVVAGSGGVESGAGPPGVESDEVDRGGEQDVFQGDFGQAFVAGAASVAGLDGLSDGALDAGAGCVALPPGLGFLARGGDVAGLRVARGDAGSARGSGRWRSRV